MSSRGESEKFELSSDGLEDPIQAAQLVPEPDTIVHRRGDPACLFGTGFVELIHKLPADIVHYFVHRCMVGYGLTVAIVLMDYSATILEACLSADEHTMIVMLCNQLRIWLDLSPSYDGDPELIPDDYFAIIDAINHEECAPIDHDIDLVRRLKCIMEDRFVASLAAYFASDAKMCIAIQHEEIVHLCDMLMRFI